MWWPELAAEQKATCKGRKPQNWVILTASLRLLQFTLPSPSKGGLIDTCHTTWQIKYHKRRVNLKNIPALRRERWGRFSLALVFPGSQWEDGCCWKCLVFTCLLRGLWRDDLCPMCLFITTSLSHYTGPGDDKDQILWSGSYRVGKHVKEGIFFFLTETIRILSTVWGRAQQICNTGKIPAPGCSAWEIKY